MCAAGNESCPQPQTSEHLAAIEIMKLKHIIILQNKIDLVKESQAQDQYKEIVKFVEGQSSKEIVKFVEGQSYKEIVKFVEGQSYKEIVKFVDQHGPGAACESLRQSQYVICGFERPLPCHACFLEGLPMSRTSG